ncbi:hypothetical protein CcarbDRAFT_5203 [Clostridium carboxidivorans P7]|uniref:Uncharacterized protein n=1 Tax=Clostridium carboxidivorans P7 TaxID=536227 RepID=C6Q2D5_9CLOT|nr:hypothetical protein CcarbDRAFT_5203 [Clostridium carboxidivorans P7]EFG88983.1 hypothetical protein CLCAR_1327 [Clostridium carboxidivorans P7]
MKKATVKIVWIIVAAAMLFPFILTILINSPKVIHWIIN